MHANVEDLSGLCLHESRRWLLSLSRQSLADGLFSADSASQKLCDEQSESFQRRGLLSCSPLFPSCLAHSRCSIICKRTNSRAFSLPWSWRWKSERKTGTGHRFLCFLLALVPHGRGAQRERLDESPSWGLRRQRDPPKGKWGKLCVSPPRCRSAQVPLRPGASPPRCTLHLFHRHRVESITSRDL